MKATTLFALTIALVLGLGAAATVKYMGLLEPKPVAAAPVKEAPPRPPMILVAGTNLFKGHAISARDVRVREARPDEVADLNLNKKDYLPAVVNAANFRVMAENLIADRPLKVSQLEPQELSALGDRISPYMRAVQLDLPKSRCAGGMIQKGEHVDVMLTTNVIAGPTAQPVTRTACIARDVRVVAKRNSLMTAIAADGGTIPFTLEANPYRAELISFAAGKGLIVLVPRAKAKAETMAPTATIARPRFSDDESEEYKDEDERVTKVENAEYTVGDKDLVRIFQLQPIPPKPKPVTVTTVKGTAVAGTIVFDRDGQRIAPPKVDPAEYEPKEYAFRKPAEAATGGAPPAARSYTGGTVATVDHPTHNPNVAPKGKPPAPAN